MCLQVNSIYLATSPPLLTCDTHASAPGRDRHTHKAGAPGLNLNLNLNLNPNSGPEDSAPAVTASLDMVTGGSGVGVAGGGGLGGGAGVGVGVRHGGERAQGRALDMEALVRMKYQERCFLAPSDQSPSQLCLTLHQAVKV